MRYRVAETWVHTNQRIAELAPFEAPGGSGCEPQVPEPPATGSAPRTEVYRGRGWIGGFDVGVVCRADGGRYHLSIEGGDEVDLFKTEEGLVLTAPRSAAEAGCRSAILGPGLALALASSGRFSFHASAISVGGRCVLILGESGVGKSTLAAEAQERSGAERIGDDVVPTTLSSTGRLLALPRFPQLKLSARDQWQGAGEVAIDGVLFLRRRSSLPGPRLVELGAREAVLRLLENTVASRLFDAELRARHLEFCARAASAARIADLEVPDGLDRLAATLEFLEIG